MLSFDEKCICYYQQVENQINELLAGQFNTADNAELEKELAEMMGESAPELKVAVAPVSTGSKKGVVLPSDLPEVPRTPLLPTAPVSNIKVSGSQQQQIPIVSQNSPVLA